MTWRFDGADQSHYQDEAGAPVDFDALFAGSNGYYATKASQRHNYIDPTMARHRSEAHRVGFRWVGLYHWQSPTSEASIAAQVANWQRAVGHVDAGEYFMLDAEQSGVTEPTAYEALDRVQQIVQRPGACYSGISVAGGAIWRSDRIRQMGTAMHLAAYMTQERLAAKLAAAGISHLPMHLNQYSSNGPVPGVTGRCDMNQVNSEAMLDAICGLTAELPIPPTPTPPPVPPIGDDMMQLVVPNQRVYDSRNVGILVANEIRTIDLGPAAVSAKAAMVCLTITGPSLSGHAEMFGTATAPPTANVNFSPGDTVSNVGLVQVTGGRINVRVSANCHVLVDLQAIYT